MSDDPDDDDGPPFPWPVRAAGGIWVAFGFLAAICGFLALAGSGCVGLFLLLLACGFLFIGTDAMRGDLGDLRTAAFFSGAMVVLLLVLAAILACLAPLHGLLSLDTLLLLGFAGVAILLGAAAAAALGCRAQYRAWQEYQWQLREARSSEPDTDDAEPDDG